MKYKIILTSREFELIAEDFDFKKFHLGLYDIETKLSLTREAWQKDIPLYLHEVGVFNPDYLKQKSEGIITTDSIFSIFNKQNLTFSELLDEIWSRRKKLVKIISGDDNPYA